MIETEKAFDLLPYVVDIYDKLELQKYIKANLRQIKESENEDEKKIEAGIDIFKHIMKNSQKVKEEFFNIVAIVDDKDVEEVKKQSLIETLNTIKKVFTNKDLVGFFKQAMQ